MRKKLSDISWNISEEVYRQDSAYSYSTLSRFNREGFDKLDSLFDKQESPSLLFGSIVDTLLTDGQQAFDDKYIVVDFPAVADGVKSVIDLLHNKCSSKCFNLSDVPDSLVLRAIDECGYQPRWKEETRVKVIREKGELYYNLKTKIKGKILVSADDYNDANRCIDELKSSPSTAWYFAPNSPFDTSIERYYQLKFKGEYNGIKVRCMMDEVVVDHKNKVIIPVDLKTSFKAEWNFYKSFVEWNYWIQAQLYWYILKQNLAKDDYYKDFTLLDYRFIVVSRNTLTPLVWEFDSTKTETDLVYGDIKLKNWRGILEELHYYMSSRPKCPKGITNKENSITYWLNKN